MKKNIAVIILAAGLGTRMKSDKAKVLHEVCGKPMISYVLDTANGIHATETVVVVGHQAKEVMAACRHRPDVKFALQEHQLGTGHAVQCALPILSEAVEHVIILCGDVPLLTVATVNALIEDHLHQSRALTLVAVEVDSPTGYGRIKMNDQRELEKIVEEKDASAEERQIRLINAGIYCVNKEFLQKAILRITSDNAQNELYLTDIVEIGYRERKNIGVIVNDDAEEVAGINTLEDHRSVEAVMMKRAGASKPR